MGQCFGRVNQNDTEIIVLVVLIKTILRLLFWLLGGLKTLLCCLNQAKKEAKFGLFFSKVIT
jgi:hypothetical protein